MHANKKSISSDLKRLDKLKDENIDYSDIPELDDFFLKKQLSIYQRKRLSNFNQLCFKSLYYTWSCSQNGTINKESFPSYDF